MCEKLSPLESAILDAIAIGETGGDDDDAAYSMVFGGKLFLCNNDKITIVENQKISQIFTQPNWPSDFPKWEGVWLPSGLPTHAAGRYQFEPKTWHDLGGGNFCPSNQDNMALKLIKETIGLFSANLSLLQIHRLSSIWPSVRSTTFQQRFSECLRAQHLSASP